MHSRIELGDVVGLADIVVAVEARAQIIGFCGLRATGLYISKFLLPKVVTAVDDAVEAVEEGVDILSDRIIEHSGLSRMRRGRERRQRQREKPEEEK